MVENYAVFIRAENVCIVLFLDIKKNISLMKQQIFIIFIFTFILHTGAKLKQDDVLLPEKSQKKFQYDMLNTHNLLRKHHGTMKLLIIILINQIF